MPTATLMSTAVGTLDAVQDVLPKLLPTDEGDLSDGFARSSIFRQLLGLGGFGRAPQAGIET